jgi:hypothetical protein
VDCNGIVDAVDSLLILRHNVGLPVTQNEPCMDIGQPLMFSGMMGDVDCSGGVSSVDALKILRSVSALVVLQAPGCPPVMTS